MEKDKKSKKPNNLLRHERERRGWSQSRLAELIGSDTSMISRWECGDRKPERIYQEKLCTLFEKDAVELGFIHPPENDEKIERREATKQIGAVVGSALLAPSLHLLEDTDVLDRLIRAAKRPSSIDTTALTHLETVTKNHWQMYARFENSVQYRYDMLAGVSGHLQTVTRLMEYPQSTHVHDRLSSLACETAQLIGEIFFDLKDNVTAEKYYNASLHIARETRNTVLLAVALGRKSFIPIYSSDPQKALPFLQEAYSTLTHDTSDIIRAWLSAREAEVYASIENADACFKALERAEFYLERAQPDTAPSFAFVGEAVDIHLTRTFLLGYKGACFTRLKQPAAAQAALKEDLASIDPARGIHNAILHVDLARTYVQQGEIEEACRYVNDALLLMVQLRSARVLQRILDLRHELEPWKNTEYVKDLDKQIIALPPIT